MTVLLVILFILIIVWFAYAAIRQKKEKERIKLQQEKLDQESREFYQQHNNLK